MGRKRRKTFSDQAIGAMQEDDNSCPVCCEEYESTTHKAFRNAACDHVFCEPCLRRLERDKWGCPICRAAVSFEMATRVEALEDVQRQEANEGDVDATVAALMEMGFSHEDSTRAASACAGDMEAALQHLLDPDLGEDASRPLPPGPVAMGTPVCVVDLRSRPDLNGKNGTCVEFVSDRERYRVALESGEVVAVRKANLRTASQAVSKTSSELKLDAKQRGNAFFKRGEYDMAIREFTNAINQDAGDYVLYSNRSAAHACKREYVAAIKDAQHCITLNPSFAKGYGRLAAANHGIGNIPGSIKAYQQALKLDPGNAALIKGLQAAQQPQASGKPKTAARGAAHAPPRAAPQAQPDAFDQFMSDPVQSSQDFFASMQSRGKPAAPPPDSKQRKRKKSEDCSMM